ncbi:hypothetical protein KGD82_13435 [Nocardiopsis eucommiae]|uniref:Uncharacterized protein n=1 Tax=Nocardiopsis eucommiae TaxID=2831970 RepID=A0A975LD82_9ACTN|nr:hypothetical protein KGD82_13435 [Nocardiopsis eucommiae]
MTALKDAITAHREALAHLTRVCEQETRRLGACDQHVIEALELLRYQLHLEVDRVNDDHQVALPPGGNAWRADRYRELRIPA